MSKPLPDFDKPKPDIVITYPSDYDGELHIQVDETQNYFEFSFRLAKSRRDHALNDLIRLPSAIAQKIRTKNV